MKVEVNTRQFADAAAWASRTLETRPVNPVLAGVRLHTGDGTLTVSAFSRAMTTREQLAAGVDEPGETVVRGKMLADIARTLPGEKTYLAVEDGKLRITSGKSAFAMHQMPVDEYPEFPPMPPETMRVDAGRLARAVLQAAVSLAPPDGPRPVLSCVRVQQYDAGLVLSSTDRFRLSRATLPLTGDAETAGWTLLVPGERLRDTAKTFDGGGQVAIHVPDGDRPRLVGLSCGNRQVTIQLVEGEFPAVDRLYADEYPVHVVMDRTLLAEAVKRAALVTGVNEFVRLVFDEGRVELQAGTDEARADETLDADLDGEHVTVAFNPHYLQQGLAALDSPLVHLSITTPIKPVEFNGQESRDTDPSHAYRYLLVPMRVGN